MPAEKVIPGGLLETISTILANRLTHPEIARLLLEARLTDTHPDLSKPKRLFNAFVIYQNRFQQSNLIQVFIQKAFHPHRFVEKGEQFEEARKEINSALLFIGIEFLPNGKFARVDKVSTIAEAQQRADNLKHKLTARNVHADVLKFCKAELVNENYFHAVFETTKSVADKIRDKSNLTLDGSELVDKAFVIGQSRTPILSFNSLINESEESEHKGFMNLLKGLFGMFRNTTAHIPKIKWEINEQDALDCLTLASFIHRKLDKCVKDRFI